VVPTDTFREESLFPTFLVWPL